MHIEATSIWIYICNSEGCLGSVSTARGALVSASETAFASERILLSRVFQKAWKVLHLLFHLCLSGFIRFRIDLGSSAVSEIPATDSFAFCRWSYNRSFILIRKFADAVTLLAFRILLWRDFWQLWLLWCIWVRHHRRRLNLPIIYCVTRFLSKYYAIGTCC